MPETTSILEGQPGREGVEIQEIEGLREPIKNLLVQLRDDIEAGNYAMIVGDDASGRIPTLIFREVLGEIYQEKDLPVPKTLFFAGEAFFDPGLEAKRVRDLKELLEKNQVRQLVGEKKVLVVSDTLVTGMHLKPVTRALQDMEAEFDIAVVGFRASYRTGDVEGARQSLQQALGGRIVFGSSRTPKIWSEYKYGGVQKPRHESIFSEVYKPAKVPEARWSLAELSRQLVEEFKASKEN